MKPKGHKIVIYFYEENGIVVDTIPTENGYKETNDNKSHFKKPDDILKAINKVYNWQPKK